METYTHERASTASSWPLLASCTAVPIRLILPVSYLFFQLPTLLCRLVVALIANHPHDIPIGIVYGRQKMAALGRAGRCPRVAAQQRLLMHDVAAEPMKGVPAADAVPARSHKQLCPYPNRSTNLEYGNLRRLPRRELRRWIHDRPGIDTQGGGFLERKNEKVCFCRPGETDDPGGTNLLFMYTTTPWVGRRKPCRPQQATSVQQ